MRRGQGKSHVFAPQAPRLMDTRGVFSLAPRLRQIERDFPGPRRFFEYPTLFWLASSDRAIRLLPWLGLVCGVVAIFGGTPGYVALACAWLIWLSFEPADCIFPWDTMLFEASFLVLLCRWCPTCPSSTPRRCRGPAWPSCFAGSP
jgi:hypothetical protein